MKKITLINLLFLSFSPLFSCGSSADNNCKNINTVAELSRIENEAEANDCYIITSDLDLSESDQSWLPIGSLDNPFQADIYGGDHIISQLQIDSSDNNLAFIAATGRSSYIEKLSFVACSVQGNNYLAGVVARHQGILADIHVECNINSASGDYIGSLVAENRGRIFRSSVSNARITGKDYLGGIAGVNFGELERVRSTIQVIGKSYLGSLVGENNGSIVTSFATGDVSGNFFLGGVAGSNTSTGIIRNNYVSGSVRAYIRSTENSVAGFVGSNQGHIQHSYTTVRAIAGIETNNSAAGFVASNLGNIQVSYWNSTISGISNDRIAGTEPLDTMQMQCPEMPNDECSSAYRDWSPEIWNFLTSVEYPIHRE